jgi:plasmid stabilization system protein ParE
VSFQVHLTREALEDLQRLEDFLIDRALDSGDLDWPLRAMDAIQSEFRILEFNPYTCRKVGPDPNERELVIPFGGTGYVALFEIISEQDVVVSAIRHQREDDFH